MADETMTDETMTDKTTADKTTADETTREPMGEPSETVIHGFDIGQPLVVRVTTDGVSVYLYFNETLVRRELIAESPWTMESRMLLFPELEETVATAQPTETADPTAEG